MTSSVWIQGNTPNTELHVVVDEMPVGGSGLTDAELRATPVEVTVENIPHVIVDSMPAGGSGLTDAELRDTPVPVTGTVSVTEPVSIDDNGGSVTIDATALPLPTGAATAALQLPDSHNVTVDNAAGASAVNIQDGGNSITVDGTVTVTATNLDVRDLVAATDAVTVHGDVGVVDQLDLANTNPLAVAIVDGAGTQITSFGGGTQYTEADTDASITGTAMLMEGAGNALVVVQGTAADGVLVNLGANNDVTVTGTVSVDNFPGTSSGLEYVYNIPSQVHVAAANTVHWDMFNADATLVVRVMGIYQLPNIVTAVTGVAFDWLLERTTAVGTGGTTITAWLPDTTQTALDADITCRSKPTGGATQSTDLRNYTIHSEETNAATQMMHMMMSGGVANLVPKMLMDSGTGIVLRQNQGIRCVQVTNSNAGNTGWCICFTVE
jgi:hypothetical protein